MNHQMNQKIDVTMGRSRVVRRRVLVPVIEGSIPFVPQAYVTIISNQRPFRRRYVILSTIWVNRSNFSLR